MTRDDEEWEKVGFDEHHIYKVNATLGSKDYTIEEVDTAGQVFTTSMLDPNFAFIIDFQQEMFVWYGRYAALVAKTVAVQEAREIAEKTGRSKTIEVTPVEQVYVISAPSLICIQR